jgi:hypothetical protein
MSRFIKNPNLPEGKARCMMIGQRYRPILEEPLEKLGAEVIWTPDIPSLPPQTAGHADMAAAYLSEGRVILARELTDAMPGLKEQLLSRGFTVLSADKPLGNRYPSDCGLNACIVGDYVILNPRAVDITLLDALSDKIRIQTAQGYARCSVCVVREGAVMSSDAGIVRACRAAGLDVLELQAGHIALAGYDYGFIGGATFKLGADTLAFTGSIAHHPDAGRITAFLRKWGVQPVMLTREPIFDIGGAVLLTEC